MMGRILVLALMTFMLVATGACKQRTFDLSRGRAQSRHHDGTLDCSQSQVLEANRHGELALRVQSFEAGGRYTIRSIKVHAQGLPAREFLHDDGKPSNFEKGRGLFRQCYEPALDLVLNLYTERRGWGDDFNEKLRTLAKQFELASEYLLVFEESEGADRKLVGTIRFISMPYITYTHREGGVVDGSLQVTTAKKVFTALDLLSLNSQDLQSFVFSESQHSKVFDEDRLKSILDSLKNKQPSEQAILPLESMGFTVNFGVGDARCQTYDLPSGKTGHHCLSAGEVIEPGNLGVLKENNKDILTIFVRAILLRMMRDDLSLASLITNRTMFTYNDKKLLYKRLGFVESPPPITKFGVEWTLLLANMSRFLGHYRMTLQEMTPAQDNQALSKIQATLAGLGWQKNLRERMDQASHESHLKFLESLYVELSRSEQDGLREICGVVSLADPDNAGRVLTELFSNGSYVLIFGDGATFNHIEGHRERGAPVCVVGYVQQDKQLTVRSVNYQRTW